MPRLAAALGGAFVVVACASPSALAAAVHGGAAGAVVGPALLGMPLSRRQQATLAALVADHPATVFAGIAAHPWLPDVYGGSDGPAVFGLTGHPSAASLDWERLARALAAAPLDDAVQRTGVAAVLANVWGPHRTGRGGPAEAGVRRFFAAAFAPGVDTAADVAARLGVAAPTLRARFVRHGLPGADRYVAAARLVRAASAGAVPAPDDVATAAWPAHPEAPARVHRAVRRLGRLAALAARRRAGSTGASHAATVLRAYLVALVLPHRDALCTFDPVGTPEP